MRLGKKVCEREIQVCKHTNEHTKFLGKDAEVLDSFYWMKLQFYL